MNKLHMPRIKSPKHTRHRHFLKEWREHRNLTQEDMAVRVKKSRTTYGRIEAGQVPYNQDFLEMAATALQCDVTDLLSHGPNDESALWALIQRLKKTDSGTRERILAVAEALAKTGS